MITNFTYLDKTFPFVKPNSTNYDKNIFTILVGKNGTGKSRLLSAIVKGVLDKGMRYKIYRTREQENNEFELGTASYKYTPKKVIAVSTSPFDRFPLTRRNKQLSYYSYLGIRELVTSNFGLAYVSKIIGSLLEAVVMDRSQISEIASVLRYLGFTDRILITLQFKLSQRIIDELCSARSPADDFLQIVKIMPAFSTFNSKFFLNEDETVSKNKVAQLIKILNKKELLAALQHRDCHIEIDQTGIHPHPIPSKYLLDLTFLLKSGCVRLQDVALQKRDTGETYSITQASSGEQSVVISILGIASQIENGSLICIDEPEICLHPQWQERYIKILTTTFSMYHGCHFIIATHSPQIISNLDTKNSFIVSMETGNIINANKVANHSADFQLANVFNSPGFQNEFLSRIALNIFAKVSKRKTFDETDIRNYAILDSQSQYLSKNDPVLDLYKAIKEMYNIYG